jgi:hypothetical protein
MKRQQLAAINGACGQHLITKVFIANGELIYDFNDAQKLDYPTYQSIQISKTSHALDTGLLACLNHSCQPNVFVNTERCCCYALRDIAAGEELSFFYPSTEWQMARAFLCLCGSDNCIGTVSGAAEVNKALLNKQLLNKHITELLKQQ